MPRFNIKENDPERYAAVKAAQDAIKKRYSSGVMLAKICPYCAHRIEMIQSGSHGPSYLKCSNCGEDVIFPPISFRTA